MQFIMEGKAPHVDRVLSLGPRGIRSPVRFRSPPSLSYRFPFDRAFVDAALHVSSPASARQITV